MGIVHPATKGISSARSGMRVAVPYAAPSGANGSWWVRCYKHVGPNGPSPGPQASGNGDGPEPGRHGSGQG